jgi:transposase
VRKPQVVPDEDHEVVYERVAAVDVAKASGVVCMRTPDPARPGRFVNRIWEDVPAMRARIAELGRELLRNKVQMVTLESTSDYWRVWFYVLESIGLAVQLVSASQARNLKGRPKTDRLDAMWLARLTQWGMLRPSLVPPAAIRRVRDFTRARTDLVRERTRCLQRLEKLLEDALLTELRGEIPQFRRRVRACVATFPAHDQRRRCAAGPVVVGGAAARVA